MGIMCIMWALIKGKQVEVVLRVSATRHRRMIITGMGTLGPGIENTPGFGIEHATLAGYPAYNLSYFEINPLVNYFQTGTAANGKIYTISFSVGDDAENPVGIYAKYWPEAHAIINSFRIVR
jgi:hypothetical protein